MAFLTNKEASCITKEVLKVMIRLQDEELASSAKKPTSVSADAATNEGASSNSGGAKMSKLMSKIARVNAAKSHQKQACGGSGASTEETCKNELNIYLSFESLPTVNKEGKHNNPLKRWKKNQCLFPTLAKLAKCYLAVQATSAPSERVFSQASLLITTKRTRLSAADC